MNIEEALLVLDIALEQKVLNDVQELVFRHSWSGQTYSEMAESSSYNANYIKDVGYKLWKLLSKVFEEEVTKSNLRSILRRRSRSISVSVNLSVSEEVASPCSSAVSPSVSKAGESLNVYTKNRVSVPISASLSQRRVSDLALPKALALEKEIDTSKKIVSGKQIEESQQTLFINTILAAPLNAENIKINSQNIKTELLTAIPQFVKAETTAQTHQGLGEAVNILAFYGRLQKLNLLKQWIMDERCRLVAVLGQQQNYYSSI